MVSEDVFRAPMVFRRSRASMESPPTFTSNLWLPEAMGGGSGKGCGLGEGQDGDWMWGGVGFKAQKSSAARDFPPFTER